MWLSIASIYKTKFIFLIEEVKMAKKEKCECRPIIGFGSIILMALGLYFLVWGFSIQTKALSWSWSALVCYLVGVVLVGFGKIAHKKGYAECKLHN